MARVFGEPIERDGVVVLPVASVRGGGGGGDRTAGSEGRQPTGSGAGYGLRLAPAGVFVLRDGQVRWQPALDVNQVILGGQLVAVVVLLAIRSILRGWQCA